MTDHRSLPRAPFAWFALLATSLVSITGCAGDEAHAAFQGTWRSGPARFVIGDSTITLDHPEASITVGVEWEVHAGGLVEGYEEARDRHLYLKAVDDTTVLMAAREDRRAMSDPASAFKGDAPEGVTVLTLHRERGVE